MPSERSSGYVSYAVSGILYLLILAAVIGGSYFARSWAISVYGSPQAQAQWDEWRAGAAKLSTEGPVKRRVPKSDKPPALVLATTYFGVCLGIAILLTTVLFATAMYFVQGVLRSPGEARNENEPRKARNDAEKQRAE
ncbi:MAG: hypothetical protein ACKVP0_13880 [Pirellulaceae bacterium]